VGGELGGGDGEGMKEGEDWYEGFEAGEAVSLYPTGDCEGVGDREVLLPKEGATEGLHDGLGLGLDKVAGAEEGAETAAYEESCRLE